MSGTAVPPGTCVTHGWHGMTTCPRCSSSAGPFTPLGGMSGRDANQLAAERDAWEARCHFCGGPCYPWLTDNETWAKVEPTLGQQQACFECFAAAWFKLGHNNGEPFRVSAGPDTPADSQEDEWFVPEGDRQCGVVHKNARATCMKRRGHDGSHATPQGTWIDGPWCEYPAGDTKEARDA